MCGIVGYLRSGPATGDAGSLVSMAAAIRHRGPDDEGYVFANQATGAVATYSSPRSPAAIAALWPRLSVGAPVLEHHLAMAQVRYSIIDLSPGGHQPMWSRCEQVCLTFNGEIYNYVELKAELTKLGCQFATHSDTEVLLTGYLQWGEEVFGRLQGFYAICLYDRRKHAVLLARDRLGKAHLYLHRKPGLSIQWASEIKAFIAGSSLDSRKVDVSAVADFVLLGRRDRGGTFWSDVEDFPAAHFAWVDGSRPWQPTRYWGLPTRRWALREVSQEEAAGGLRAVLSDALRQRLRADVPIGFELSGGTDSSALVGLAAGHLGVNLTTYTVEFEEAHSNEEPFARAVAARYPDQITYRVIRQARDHFWQEADDYIWLLEEPFHAPNLHTNQYLRRLIKRSGAHVVITGAASDELLAGYAGEYLGPFFKHLIRHGQLRRFLQEARTNTEIPVWRNCRALIMDLVLSQEQHVALSQWRTGEGAILGRILSPSVLEAPRRMPSMAGESAFHGRMVSNMTYRLMNYWLRSAAKSDYGIPIEARSPFLDHRVVEYCCQLPPEYVICGGWHKHVLRKAVEAYLPAEVLWRRRKMGFPFPYREWLLASRGVVRHNAEGVDCPYLNLGQLFEGYEKLVEMAPLTLWRLISVMLWWRRVIERKPILPG